VEPRRDAHGLLDRFRAECAAPHGRLHGGPRSERASCPASPPQVGAGSADKEAGKHLPCGLTVKDLAAGLEYLRTQDLREILPRITVPVHVFHGLEDRIIAWKAGERLALDLPQAQFHPVAGMGHDLPLRCPEMALALLKDSACLRNPRLIEGLPGGSWA
jgi:pimeloyl-ACP methyl ester carboxylesterase